MAEDLPASWAPVLEPVLTTPEARRLGGFLRAEEEAGKAIYPPQGCRLLLPRGPWGGVCAGR